jgi:hypothetical protein
LLTAALGYGVLSDLVDIYIPNDTASRPEGLNLQITENSNSYYKQQHAHTRK